MLLLLLLPANPLNEWCVKRANNRQVLKGIIITWLITAIRTIPECLRHIAQP